MKLKEITFLNNNQKVEETKEESHSKRADSYRNAKIRKDNPEGDFYATSPKAGHDIIKYEPQLNNIWECACGMGHLAKVFDSYNKLKRASDAYDRGYKKAKLVNFLLWNKPYSGDIVTNPPYKLAKEFILKSLDIVQDGRYVCMFLPITYLESLSRYNTIFRNTPPARVWVYVKRVVCAKNGDFQTHNSALTCYAWYVWHKGNYNSTELKWILNS